MHTATLDTDVNIKFMTLGRIFAQYDAPAIMRHCLATNAIHPGFYRTFATQCLKLHCSARKLTRSAQKNEPDDLNRIINRFADRIRVFETRLPELFEFCLTCPDVEVVYPCRRYPEETYRPNETYRDTALRRSCIKRNDSITERLLRSAKVRMSETVTDTNNALRNSLLGVKRNDDPLASTHALLAVYGDVFHISESGLFSGPTHAANIWFDDKGERHRVMLEARKRGFSSLLSPELFASVFLACDDFYTVGAPTESTKLAERFYRILQRVPMEMQMIICQRVYGSTEDIIPAKLSMPAAKLVLAMSR